MIKICPICGKEFIDKKHPNKICCSVECAIKNKTLNLVGKKFGKLTVLSRIENKNSYCLCQCECGTVKTIRVAHLTTGKIKSCGCIARQKASQRRSTHKLSNTRIYRIYYGMKRRCFEIKNPAYRLYGERGITICQEWLDDFMNFYNWAMANGYKEGLTIERIDVNGNYCPENCCWIPLNEQSKNTRSNHFLTFKGETKTIAEWSRITNIDNRKINYRLNKLNWTVEKTLTTP